MQVVVSRNIRGDGIIHPIVYRNDGRVRIVFVRHQFQISAQHVGCIPGKRTQSGLTQKHRIVERYVGNIVIGSDICGTDGQRIPWKHIRIDIVEDNKLSPDHIVYPCLRPASVAPERFRPIVFKIEG